jgi:diguanylate cyclase (GGDEF)-like protein
VASSLPDPVPAPRAAGTLVVVRDGAGVRVVHATAWLEAAVLELAEVGAAVEAALGHGRSWGGEVALDGHVTGVEVVPLGDLAVVVVGTPAVSGRLLDAVLAASLDATSIVRLLRDEEGEPFDLLVVDTNDRGARLLRRPRGEIVGQRVSRLLPPDGARRLTAVCADVERTGEPMEEEVPAGVPGTEIEWVRRHVARLARDQLVIATRDVTGTRLEEAGDTALRHIALAIAERRELGDVLDLVAEEAVGLLGGDQAVVLRLEDGARAGQAGVDLWPAPDDAAGEAAALALDTGRPVYFDDLDEHADDDAAARALVARGVAASAAAPIGEGPDGPWGLLLVRARRRHGLRRAMIGRLAGLADLARLAVVNAESRAHAFQLARTDELTGLPNRRAFGERLSGEVARARRAGSPLGLAILDLDGFKGVNDRHGHATGDRVLCAVADALRVTVREGELLARVGGEEFGWILPGADLPAGVAAAERARAAVAAVRVPGVEPSTISVGVSVLAGEEEASDLQRAADDALYRAKEGGRDRVAAGGDGS